MNVSGFTFQISDFSFQQLQGIATFGSPASVSTRLCLRFQLVSSTALRLVLTCSRSAAVNHFQQHTHQKCKQTPRFHSKAFAASIGRCVCVCPSTSVSKIHNHQTMLHLFNQEIQKRSGIARWWLVKWLNSARVALCKFQKKKLVGWTIGHGKAAAFTFHLSKPTPQLRVLRETRPQLRGASTCLD